MAWGVRDSVKLGAQGAKQRASASKQGEECRATEGQVVWHRVSEPKWGEEGHMGEGDGRWSQSLSKVRRT